MAISFPKNIEELEELLQPRREKAEAERAVIEAAKAWRDDVDMARSLYSEALYKAVSALQEVEGG